MSDQPADGPASDNPSPKAIRLEEFKILRAEVEQRASEQRIMERNVVLATGAIYSFLLTQHCSFAHSLHTACKLQNAEYVQLAWYLPPIINLLAFIRWRDSALLIEMLAAYLRKAEVSLMPGSGWEHFLYKMRGKQKPDDKQAPDIITISTILFWIVMCAGTLVVANQIRPLLETATLATSLFLGSACSLFIYWRTLPISLPVDAIASDAKPPPSDGKRM
jgi:hypothetical protein